MGVNGRERMLPRNDKQLRAIVRIGQSVNFAVERFAVVGEALGDDNPEIRAEMYEACKDARQAASLIEQLCSLTAPSLRGLDGGATLTEMNYGSMAPDGTTIRSYADRTAMNRTARSLLASVTQVLLVADTVVVRQIVANKDRVSISGPLGQSGLALTAVCAWVQLIIGEQVVCMCTRAH